VENNLTLVTGAAGKTGKAVITALIKRQVPVRALVHLKDHEPLMYDLGVSEVITGDMNVSSVLEEAARGIQTIYYICSNVNPDEYHLGEKVIAAARKAHTAHFVYHSVLHPQIEAMPHHWLKMRVEEALIRSGLPFTILQPTAYMQNIFQSWEAIKTQGIYAVPYLPETRLSIVDLEDVAETAARVMTEPAKHLFATYELVGPQALSQNEAAEILSQELQQSVRAAGMPRDLWEAKMRSGGMDDYERDTLLKMFTYYEQYGFFGNPTVLEHLLQKPAATFQSVVRRHILREK
jgi:uncharacterized protein YbjT (DUF2867 family)